MIECCRKLFTWKTDELSFQWAVGLVARPVGKARRTRFLVPLLPCEVQLLSDYAQKNYPDFNPGRPWHLVRANSFCPGQPGHGQGDGGNRRCCEKFPGLAG